MKGKKLSFPDMKSGDVLLFENMSGFSHGMISTAQTLFSHGWSASSNVTHAGLYDGAGKILESSGEAGLRSMELIEKHAGYKFQVYRLTRDRATAMTAAIWAKRLINKAKTDTSFGKYGKKMAVKGILTSSKSGKGVEKARETLFADPYATRMFYCSNFVVECYELAGETVGNFNAKFGSGDYDKHAINVDYRKISPKLLQGNLRNSPKWDYIGNYTV